MGSLPDAAPLLRDGEEEEIVVVDEGSWTTRSFGREVREEDEARLWLRWRYSKTVPSANPMERWARLRDRAMHETG